MASLDTRRTRRVSAWASFLACSHNGNMKWDGLLRFYQGQATNELRKEYVTLVVHLQHHADWMLMTVQHTIIRSVTQSRRLLDIGTLLLMSAAKYHFDDQKTSPVGSKVQLQFSGVWPISRSIGNNNHPPATLWSWCCATTMSMPWGRQYSTLIRNSNKVVFLKKSMAILITEASDTVIVTSSNTLKWRYPPPPLILRLHRCALLPLC